MKFKIFIISISRNIKRYESLLEKLKSEGFDLNNIEVFFGIDYKNLSKYEINKVRSTWGLFTPKSVIACALSHVLLWRYISTLKDKLDYALILEDDSYVIKKQFDKYQKMFEEKINDSTFLNLSTSLRVSEHFYKNTDLFVDSHVILSLDTYILTPGLCYKLYEYYKKNGITYHIDFHLTFIKKQIPMTLVHFNRKITKDNMRLESSMVPNHDKKFLLKYLKNTGTYKELNTPIIELNDFVINVYIIYLVMVFLLILLITFLFAKTNMNTVKLSFFYLLWLIFGFLLYDAI